MDSYKEANTTYKKRMVAPLVLLVFAMVSFTALGFAYMHASELAIEKNTLDSKYYEIDYTDSEGVSINDKLDAVEITAYTDIDVDTSTSPETRTFNAYLNGATIDRTFYVTIRSDMSADTEFTLTTTVEFGDVLGQFLTNTVTYDKAVVKTGDTVAITLRLTIEDAKDIKTITGITPSGNAIDDVSDLSSALDSICSNTYNIKVTATPTA